MVRARTIFVCMAAVVMVLAGGHFAWFLVFGPPARWGSGVEDAAPRFADVESPAAARYAAAPGVDSSSSNLPAEAGQSSGVAGRVLHFDEVAELGYSVLQTHAGRYWSQNQHLYFRRTGSADWREVPLPQDFIADNPRLVRLNGRVTALVERWNSWWPYSRSYRRFVLSVTRPELRAQYAVYALEFEGGTLHYLFPGHDIVLSPNREFAAYTTSENDISGFHGIRVWEVGRPGSEPVLSLWEGDPGSGISFDYKWVPDSHALLIEGGTQGFLRSGPVRYRKFRLVYLVKEKVLCDLGG